MIQQLQQMQDITYRDFHAKLIPNISKDKIIGVRTPLLRKFAKQLSKEQQQSFMQQLPHQYYEENQVHAFCMEQIKDVKKCLEAIDTFLPYVDNWATCDMMRPKVIKKDLSLLYTYIIKWLSSHHEYTIRYAIQCLMLYYLDDEHIEASLNIVSSIHESYYYVKMMQAWFYATALIDHYDKVIALFESGMIAEDLQLMSIQKALDSKRIDKLQKEQLRRKRIYIKRSHG